jgi:hypothetical protein
MNSSKLKKNYCTFIKEYKEPVNKYNIFSYSLFYISKYIHFYKDFSFEHQNKFLYNLTINIQNLERGFLGNNWYIRIFYDKNLFKFKIGTKKPWYEFITKYKNCEHVQFIEFKCQQFENKFVKESHLNLFGTFPRLYPIFEQNDLLETVVVLDADNMITNDFFNEILEFKKTKYAYNSFCSNYEFLYYRSDEEICNSKNNKAIDNDNYYLKCGMVSFNVKIPIEIWNYIFYQLKTFDNIKFAYLIDKLYDYHRQLMPEKKIKSYKDFEYGMDEIVLNYYIKKYMDDNNYKLRMVPYKPLVLPLINIITTYLKYNSSNEVKQKDIVATLLKNILKEDYKGKLENDLDAFNKLYYNNIKLNSSYDEIIPYIEILKNNFELLKKLNLPNTITYFIKNIGRKNFDNIKDYDSYFYSNNFPSYF